MNQYEVVLHFPGGRDVRVVAEGENMDEAIARAKQTEGADSVASTTRRI